MNDAKCDLIRWWDALDKLTGREDVRRETTKGLLLAQQSRHPDAQWLCSLFPGKTTLTKKKVLRAMEACGQDARALFIRGQICGDAELLRQAAELGFAPAQAEWAGACGSREGAFRWSERAAAHGDRAGKLGLGLCLQHGVGCERDPARAAALCVEAAELGLAAASYECGASVFGPSDWQRYRWWGEAAARGSESAEFDLAEAALEQLWLLEAGKGSSRAVFELGAVLKGHTDVAKRCIFREEVIPKKLDAARRCIGLHDQWVEVARKAIRCWLLVGRRLWVAKDMRLLIARMLWEERGEWSKKRD